SKPLSQCGTYSGRDSDLHSAFANLLLHNICAKEKCKPAPRRPIARGYRLALLHKKAFHRGPICDPQAIAPSPPKVHEGTAAARSIFSSLSVDCEPVPGAAGGLNRRKQSVEERDMPKYDAIVIGTGRPRE